MKLKLVLACVFATLAAFVIACSGGDDGGGAAAARTLTLGSTAFSDHGGKNATGLPELTVEAGTSFFSPTFIQGTAGQKIKLTLTNNSDSIHNFSIPGVIDKDLAQGSRNDIEVTFPTSGALLFVCKYHAGAGMNGELIVGSATPVVPPPPASTVKIASKPELGSFLTDANGMTLYTYGNDVQGSGKSNVNGQLAQAWPPLIMAAGSPVKPEGLTGDLTLITRDDGAKQVAYKGWPLYLFTTDRAPGDTTGDKRGNVWFIIAP